jgi:hypothetical protein
MRAASLRAYDTRTGKELWSHNNGQGHNGGIISYKAKGKQYVAVMTGWGGLAGDDYGSFFGGTFAQMPKGFGGDQGIRASLIRISSGAAPRAPFRDFFVFVAGSTAHCSRHLRSKGSKARTLCSRERTLLQPDAATPAQALGSAPRQAERMDVGALFATSCGCVPFGRRPPKPAKVEA